MTGIKLEMLHTQITHASLYRLQREFRSRGSDHAPVPFSPLLPPFTIDFPFTCSLWKALFIWWLLAPSGRSILLSRDQPQVSFSQHALFLSPFIRYQHAKGRDTLEELSTSAHEGFTMG